MAKRCKAHLLRLTLVVIEFILTLYFCENEKGDAPL